MLKLSNSNGDIMVYDSVIAQIVGNAATSCFGVVGMASRNTTDDIVSLLRWDNIEKGVKVTCVGNEIKIELHIIVTYGVNIPAITQSIMHKVSYSVEEITGFKVIDVEVYIDSIKI